VEPIAKLIAAMTDYRNDDGTNVRAEGSRKLAVFNLSEQGFTEKESESFAQSNLVSARWVFQREVRRRYHGALQVASTAESKFDARIGIGSNAYHHMTQLAERVVEAYLENVELVQKRVDPYEVGSILARPDEVLKFEHALHDGYEELNGFELDFAQCLDNTKLAWCRNPSRTGYGIPLITIGSTSTFYPDFLVWKKSTVFALDTKGGHVLHEAVARKLLRIETTREADQRIAIRFISRGKWNVSVAQESQDGVTIWGLKQDGTRRAVHFDDIPSALKSALKEA
jgi:type III restriction enzyme